jgi:hypothetical protein
MFLLVSTQASPWSPGSGSHFTQDEVAVQCGVVRRIKYAWVVKAGTHLQRMGFSSAVSLLVHFN